jgi:hypothetical protein
MQNEMTTKTEIISLLESRTRVSLENIRQFILDLDKRDHMQFLYPSDPDIMAELDGRDTEATAILQTVRDIEGTLRGLAQAKIRVQ